MKRPHFMMVVIFTAILLSPQAGKAQPKSEYAQGETLEDLLNTTVSTASKYEQSMSEAPASVSIISREDIERFGFSTLAEAIASVRGFYLSYDRNYSYLGTRGFSRPSDYNNRILLLINGHTLNEYVYGSALIGTEFAVNLDVVERIEVIRGPGSALYGTNAMFAVVNIITKRGRSADRFKMSGRCGSYGTIGSAISLGKEFESGADIYISGSVFDSDGQDLYFREFDDPATNNGIASGLDWDKNYGLTAVLTYHNLIIQGILTSREKGIPTGPYEIEFNHQTAKSLDERSFIEAEYNRGIDSNKNFMFRGYFDHYGYYGVYPYETDLLDASDNNWAGGELQFRWDIRPENRLTAGLEYSDHFRRDYRAWDSGGYNFDKNLPLEVFSLYLQDEYQIRRYLSLTLGTRHDHFSTVGNAFTPKLAILLNPLRSTTVKLLYGKAFRAPNLYETDYEDPRNAKGNPALKPEESETYELILEQNFGGRYFGVVSVYNYDVENMIDQVIDPADSLMQFRNINKARGRGVEFELAARQMFGLSWHATYNYQNAEDVLLGTTLTNSPNHIAEIGLSYPWPGYLHTAVETRYESERLTIIRSKTDSYFLTNLNFIFKPKSEVFKLVFSIRNLFDVDYQCPGGLEHLQEHIAQNGRNIGIRFEIKP